jgi:hypothetical protein
MGFGVAGRFLQGWCFTYIRKWRFGLSREVFYQAPRRSSAALYLSVSSYCRTASANDPPRRLVNEEVVSPNPNMLECMQSPDVTCLH